MKHLVSGLTSILSLISVDAWADLQVPTDYDVAPDIFYTAANGYIGNCRMPGNGPVSIAQTGEDANNNPTGYAKFLNMTCFPVRVSGRGFGVRTVDACAVVTWDATAGEILEIRNVDTKFQPPAGYVPNCTATSTP